VSESETGERRADLRSIVEDERANLAWLGNLMRAVGGATWWIIALLSMDELGSGMFLGASCMLLGALVAMRVRVIRMWGTAIIDVPLLFVGLTPYAGTVSLDFGLLTTAITIPIVLMASLILGARGAVVVGFEALVLAGFMHVWSESSMAVAITSLMMLAFIMAAGVTVERRVLFLGSAVADSRERRARLARFFSPEVARHIEKSVVDAPRRREVTVLFSDLRNFTAMSEGMSPEEVVKVLNEVHTAMVQCVFDEGGTLDKFLGDGMLVYFGAPLDQPDHRSRALRTAGAMIRALEALNAKNGETMQMSIGVHTGEVVVGPVGSPKCREYTVLGDTVNVAARIESLNRQLGTMILASADTLLATDGWVTKGTHLLRGRRRPIEVYTPEVATDGALPCVEALISMS
jgi:adenylate cyclase